jgi:hypothetical protein
MECRGNEKIFSTPPSAPDGSPDPAEMQWIWRSTASRCGLLMQATLVGDNETRELLKSILVDEKDHIDRIEAQQDQIAQMGIENYLARQTG